MTDPRAGGGGGNRGGGSGKHHAADVRPINCALVVESDPEALRALVLQTSQVASRVLQAQTVAEALDHLQDHPDLILLLVHLKDGHGEDVVRASRALHPRPMIVAFSGKASACDAFRLACLGVGAFLAKPFVPEEIGAAIDDLRRAHPCVCDAASDPVGRLSLTAVANTLRTSMCQEDFARTLENKAQAAELLRLSRQVVQHYLRQLRSDPEGRTES